MIETNRVGQLFAAAVLDDRLPVELSAIDERRDSFAVVVVVVAVVAQLIPESLVSLGIRCVRYALELRAPPEVTCMAEPGELLLLLLLFDGPLSARQCATISFDASCKLPLCGKPPVAEPDPKASLR